MQISPCLLIFKFITVFLIFISSTYSYSFDENNLELSMGLGAGLGGMSGDGPHESYRPTAVFHSQLAYTLSQIKLAICSYTNIYESHHLQINVDNNLVTGKASLLSVSFGPKASYYTQVVDPISNQPIYLTAGLLVSLQTLKFQKGTISGSGEFNFHQKITNQSYGGFLGCGLTFESDDENQTFLEIIYKILIGNKFTRVGGSDRNAKILAEDKSDNKIKEQAILIIAGIKLF